MRILGQFRLMGQPDRFVWIRGFEDMVQRRQALEAFYGGPYWGRWKGPANDMMIEWHRVHLLRPSGGSWPLADRLRHSPPSMLDEPANVVATFFGANGSGPDEARERIGSALEQRGYTIQGTFLTEMAENDFPHLPVIQEPDLQVILSLRPGNRGSKVDHAEISEVLVLEPTERSALGRSSLEL